MTVKENPLATSTAQLTLAKRPESAVAARRFLRTEGRLDQRRQAKADVLVTELTANVISHADLANEFTIDLKREQSLGLVVSVRHDHPAPLGDVESGVGFFLLERLARVWGHDHESGQLSVWFKVPTPGGYNPYSRLSDDELFALMDEEPQLCSDELFRRHADLADVITRRYVGKGVDTDDLMQVARMSLLKAIQRYDSRRGNIRHYAASSISGELKNVFRDKAWAVRVPRGLQEDVLEVGRGTAQLQRSLMREPEVHEIAEYLDIDELRVTEALNARNAYNSISVDQEHDDGGEPLVDRLEEQDLRLLMAEDRVVLERAVDSLDERKRDIIHLRFNEDLTQSEIAKRLGISQMHVSRLISSAVQEMRLTLEGEPDNALV